MGKLFSFLTTALAPISSTIDALHVSDEERGKLRVAFMEIQGQLLEKLIAMEAQSQHDDATGQSWLQRNWRPLTMLTFLVLIVCNAFGLTERDISEQAWTLLQFGFGSYIVGRSAEKVIPQLGLKSLFDKS